MRGKMLRLRRKAGKSRSDVRSIGAFGLGVALAAVTVMLLAASGAHDTEASAAGSSTGHANMMADSDPGCLPLSTVVSSIGPNGQTVYQALPISGDPSALYTQCGGIICGDLSLGGLNSCLTYCPSNSLQIYGYSPLGCPGPAATIYFAPSPTSVSCGGATNFEVVVLDAIGLRVLNGASVSFTTTLGYISSSEGTRTGIAETSLTIPPKQSGQALITATSGSAKAQKLVTVTC